MRLMLLIALPFAGLADDVALLDAIAAVESGNSRLAVGDGGRALGAWQMHSPAWADANAYRKSKGLPELSRSDWRSSDVQTRIAEAFLLVVKARLLAAGVGSPTPGQIALCWNQGCAGAIRNGLRATNYSNRVSNLVATRR